MKAIVQVVDWSSLSSSERRAVLGRPGARADASVRDTVAAIFADIQSEGYAAVERWARQIDKYAPQRIELNANTIARARQQVSATDIAAIEQASDNIRRYHEATRPRDTQTEPCPGVRCEQVWRPLAACGVYVPGGTAPLFSTLLMLAIPAKVAGIIEIEIATPPNTSGEAEPAIIAAAAQCGVRSLWLLGGAQAIAAMTFGAGLSKVDKLFGPGNTYVAEAKRFAAALSGGPQVDTPAGPSELMVIADASARPDFVAADLLSQAEHDEEAQVILVTTSPNLSREVQALLAEKAHDLPRWSIVSCSLHHARCILVDDIETAIEIANRYAPEHLSLQVTDAPALVAAINNAGAVFVGPWSAETFGDYVCGPSHVLPTDGAARAWSGVSVASFMKCVNVQTLTQTGALALRDSAARLARLEGLEAHARAADVRGVR